MFQPDSTTYFLHGRPWNVLFTPHAGNVNSFWRQLLCKTMNRTQNISSGDTKCTLTAHLLYNRVTVRCSADIKQLPCKVRATWRDINSLWIIPFGYRLSTDERRCWKFKVTILSCVITSYNYGHVMIRYGLLLHYVRRYWCSVLLQLQPWG